MGVGEVKPLGPPSGYTPSPYSLFQKKKCWNPDIIGYWVIWAGCWIGKDLKLSPSPPNCSKDSWNHCSCLYLSEFCQICYFHFFLVSAMLFYFIYIFLTFYTFIPWALWICAKHATFIFLVTTNLDVKEICWYCFFDCM